MASPNVNNKSNGTIQGGVYAATPDTLADGDSAAFLLDPTGRLRVAADLNAADIQVGAVEIKDGTTDTRAKVKTDGTDNAQVVTQNTQPLPTGAATETTLAAVKTATELIDDGVATIGGAVPAKGMLAAGTDGTNPRALKTDASGELQIDVLTMPAVVANLAGDDADLDSGAGTDNHDVVAIGLPASGGHVVGGTSTNPLRTDPTGTTTQPVSGTVTANAGTNLNTSALGLEATQADVKTAAQLLDDIVHAANAALSKIAAIGGQMDDAATVAATEGNVSAVRINANRSLHVNLRTGTDGEAGIAATPLRVDPTGTTVQPVDIRKTTKTLQRASINIATIGDNQIIAAPGVGNTIKIVAIELQNTSDTDVVAILKDGTTAINGAGFRLKTDAGGWGWSAPGGPGMGEMALADNAAFVINLSASKQVSGFVVYRTDA